MYSQELIKRALHVPLQGRLPAPDATGEAYAKFCGSHIIVDIQAEGHVITAFGQDIEACALGRTAAAIVAERIIGTTFEECEALRQVMHAMLKDNGPAPDGRWGELAVLMPIRDYPQRHASTLLIFEALHQAIARVKHSQIAC